MVGLSRTAALATGTVGSLVTAGLSFMAGARATTVATRSLVAFALFAALGLVAAQAVSLSGSDAGQEKKTTERANFEYVIPPELPANLGLPGVRPESGIRRFEEPGGPEEIGPGRPAR